ncbi:MAG: DnaA/Hda family protein, partial [Planctomycetota bacterium]
MSSQKSSSTTVEEVWERLRLAITSTIGEMRMKRWFQDVTPSGLDDGVLRLMVPSRTALEWIENNYGDTLCREARQAGLESIQLIPARGSSQQSSTSPQVHSEAATVGRSAVVRDLDLALGAATHPDSGERSAVSRPRTRDGAIPGGPAGLRKDLTLERFVVGKSNLVAHSAALEILRTPGVSFNPLFLHGGSGLGKTHLLQAITRKFFIQGERDIRYVQCESFVHQFVRALRQQSLERFRTSFRDLKVLVIDDVQMIAGKRSSQQELLETFDAIAAQGGQVLLACDVPPRKLLHLHQQLQNRFSAGLVVRVDPPDMETRVSILQQEVIRS